MNLKDYVVKDIQQTLQYLPSAVYLALACIVIYVFLWLMHYLFHIRGVSKKDGRRRKIMSNIVHMLCCGAFAAYMYMLVMIVYYSREPGSRSGVIDMELWSTWGSTMQTHAYFIENIILFVPFGILFPMVFKKWIRWFTIPAGALISAGIEYTQLVTGRGYCQIDDLVTNTAGAVIGFLIFWIAYSLHLVWIKREEH